jgi:hypothetical protein
MRKCVAFVVPGLLALLLGAAPADPKPAEPPAVDPARLVVQLGDEDFQKREQATEQLRKQGLAAISALRAAANHPDLEVRQRVQELLAPLERTILLSPRRVSLAGADRTCRQLLDDLAKQTGYGIDCFGVDAAKVYSIDLKDVPFWEALDRICKEAGLVAQPSFGTDRIRLAAQGAYCPYVHYKGLFRFAAVNVTQVQNLDLLTATGETGPRQQNNNLTFTFTVSAEPRLALLAVGEPHIDSAYDADRNCLLPPPPPSEPTEPLLRPGLGGGIHTTRRFGARSQTQQIELNLVRPSERTKSIKALRGSVPLTLLVAQKQVVLSDNPLEDRNKKIVVDHVTFVVEEMTQLPTKQYQLRLSATDEGDGTLLNTLYQRIEIADVKGNKMTVNSSGWSGNGTNNVRLTMTFGVPNAANAPEAPGKISFQSWTTLVHHQEFEFRDIPLP